MPTSSLYVCVEDGNGNKLIDGVTYAAGQTIPTETAAKLMITLGNDAVQMKVNGKPVTPDARVADRIRADAREDHSFTGGPAADLRMSESAGARLRVPVREPGSWSPAPRC